MVTVELPLSQAPSDRQELSAAKYLGPLEAADTAGKSCCRIGRPSQLNREAQDDPVTAHPSIHTRGPKEQAHTRLVRSVNDNIIHTTSKPNISHVINRK